MGVFEPMYRESGDTVDFETFGYANEIDEDWTEARESDENCNARAIDVARHVE
jgi:hypothetical protein